jgi:hypothetical protein
MGEIEAALAQLRRLSYPDGAFSALFDRHPPVSRDHSRKGTAKGPDDFPSPTARTAGLRASIASTTEQLAAATALVESRYAWRGYSLEPGGAATPSGVTLVALQTGATLGTVTLRLDGPAGLAADEGYRATIDAVRARGRQVCELTRLAIDAAADWRATLGALFGLAYLVGRVLHDATDVFVEVNPRHERFYRQMFGFVTAAGQRLCPRVKAPAVLLRLELERLDARLAALALAGRGRFAPRLAHALAA